MKVNKTRNQGLENLAGFEDLETCDLKTLSEMQDDYIQTILRLHDDNIARAAEILGLSPSTLYRWRQKNAI